MHLLAFLLRIAMLVIAWNLIPDSAEWYTKLGILALAAFHIEVKTTKNGRTRRTAL